MFGMLSGMLLSLISPFLTQAMVDNGIGMRDMGVIATLMFAQLFLFLGSFTIGTYQQLGDALHGYAHQHQRVARLSNQVATPTYDTQGNMLTKTDAINNQGIEYNYDYLMRLESWTVGNDTESVTYDATTGNIISKSDLGDSSEFVYDSTSKPHALRGINDVSWSWECPDLSITYTDFSKVESIQRGNDSYNIMYGVDKQRACTQKTISGVTTTRHYAANHEVLVDSLGRETYIIYLCNGSIVVYEKASDVYMLYHGYYDAQGSLIALTDNSGNVLARYAYDPWGSRVSPIDWTQSADAPDVLGINRGYTMHEHLDEFDLINMNGRVYDPAVAQFLSPDPYIQDAGNWLNYNRYAYCYNNPTRYVDPDGEIAITATILLGVAASAAIDYGTQVVFNYLKGYKGTDAWVDQIDFFDVAVSGIIGGVTAGVGTAVISDYSRYVELGEILLTSAVNFQGGEWNFSTMNEFMSEAIMGMVSQIAIEGIARGVSDCVESIRMKNVPTNNTIGIGDNVNSPNLSLSQHNVSPYSVGDIINANDPKIGLKLEGHHTMSFIKDGYKIIYNTHTQRVLKSFPVSDMKWNNAIKSFQFYHPEIQLPY